MAHYLSQRRVERPVWLEPADISFLKAGISSSEARIDVIASEIVKLEQQIASLRGEKETKLVEIAAARNVLAPIRRVPIEILSSILRLACCSDDRRHVVGDTYKVAGVCTAWREAAFHATSSIWSTVHLNFSDSPKSFEGASVWLREWIPRSRGLPLELELDFTSSDMSGRKYDPQRNAELLGYIVEHHDQIRTLHLSAYPSLYLPLFQGKSSASSSFLQWPLLEELSLEIIGKWDDSMDDLLKHFPNKIETFLAAPKLRSVKVKESSAKSGASMLGKLALPADQVETLNIDVRHSAPVFDPEVLQDCRNLVSLAMTQSFNGCAPPSSSVRLPGLKSLDISCGPLGTEDLLQYLTLPLLEDLTIRNNGQTITELARNLEEFQNRSATKLSSLTFSGFSMNTEDTDSVIAILPLFPNLTSFTILGFRSDVGPLLGALTLDGEPSQRLLPNLRNLALGWKKLYQTPWTPPSELVTTIRSRRRENLENCQQVSALLQSVTLHGINLNEELFSLLKNTGITINCV